MSINIPASFRDPSGFLFFQNALLYRQINKSYKENYDCLMSSGLYKDLSDSGLLIPHEDADNKYARSNEAYKIIKPEPLPFISYPYEWCFSQLRDAALLTLKIQRKSLQYDMSLKDCSVYNVQFKKAKPIFIDTLSFEKYDTGKPWVAYRQFCQHFLAPLALMAYKDIRLSQLFRIYIDGIPLDLASKLLPFSSCLNLPLLLHIHLHAKSQRHFADKRVNLNRQNITRLSFLGLIDNLESAVKRLKWKPKNTEWADYYDETNYSEEAFKHKKQIVADFLNRINPRNVWDFGANTGIFSRIASAKGIQTISFDNDPAACEKNYLECIKNNETNTLPLLLDLTNPSPGIGWDNQERASLSERGPTDMLFALALVHHLAISNNLSFEKIADFFNKNCNSLVIEFIPKDDSQVQRLLTTREDIFDLYTQESFEKEFKKYFAIQQAVNIIDSKRTLYLMIKKQIMV